MGRLGGIKEVNKGDRGKTGEERFNRRETEGEAKVELIWEEPEEDLESLGVGGQSLGKEEYRCHRSLRGGTGKRKELGAGRRKLMRKREAGRGRQEENQGQMEREDNFLSTRVFIIPESYVTLHRNTI